MYLTDLSLFSNGYFSLQQTKPYGISVTLGLPPDTDTPGFENEEKSKPLETKLISEAGGLYKPEVVAEQLMKDVLVSERII